MSYFLSLLGVVTMTLFNMTVVVSRLSRVDVSSDVFAHGSDLPTPASRALQGDGWVSGAMRRTSGFIDKYIHFKIKSLFL